jgi:hypothetical protein
LRLALAAVISDVQQHDGSTVIVRLHGGPASRLNHSSDAVQPSCAIVNAFNRSTQVSRGNSTDGIA